MAGYPRPTTTATRQTSTPDCHQTITSGSRQTITSGSRQTITSGSRQTSTSGSHQTDHATPAEKKLTRTQSPLPYDLSVFIGIHLAPAVGI